MKAILSALLAMASLTSAATAARHKISPDAPASADAATTVKVLIQWTIPVGPATSAKIAAVGGSVIHEMKNLWMGQYSVPASALATLDGDAAVKYVSVDRKVGRKLAYASAAVNAPFAWNSGFSGAGVGVAVVDSGIDSSDNLGLNGKKTIVYAQDFTGNTSKSQAYGRDWYGHGQHVAGIIASNGKQSLCDNCFISMVGIAPGASLIDLKVLDESGQGNDSAVIAAIDQAITLRATYNIRVLNLSLGRPVFESYTLDPLCQAVEAAWKAGITVVVAAGNDGRDNSFGNAGYGTITAPGNDPAVITVGAMKSEGTPTRTDDLIASYSSKGPTMVDHIVKPDIVAPGNQIVSLLAQNGRLPLANPQNAVPISYYQTNAPRIGNPPPTPALPTDRSKQPPNVNFGPGMSNVYYTLSGTSMAAAVASGAVANVLQAFPNLTPDQVKLLLMQTAHKTFPTSSTVVDASSGNTYIDYYDIFTVGAGYLDVQAALTAAPNLPVTTALALSPISSYDPVTGNSTINFDPASIWADPSLQGTRCLWGTNSVFGSSVLQGNQASVFGARCLWGTSVDAATRCLWGTSSVWSTAFDSTTGIDTAEAITVTGEN